MQATIVVPTIREDSLAEFLRRWEPEFSGQRVLVIEDNPTRSFSCPEWVEHYCWEDIDEQLGDDAWIIPRRTDCIRSFGYYLASQQSSDFIVTLDDDCYPEQGSDGGYLSRMQAALDARWPVDRWWNTLSAAEIRPRGYPYDVREAEIPTLVHHGLWSNVPDLDALTQRLHQDLRTPPATRVDRIPTGRYFPMCGMNLAFRPEAVPGLYFLLMGKGADGRSWPFDRFGDIWCGVILKRIADHLGFAMSSGAPSVHHARASSVDINLAKERPGYPINEELWHHVDAVRLTAPTIGGCYVEMARGLGMSGEYWDTLGEAMEVWARLFPDG